MSVKIAQHRDCKVEKKRTFDLTVVVLFNTADSTIVSVGKKGSCSSLILNF